MTDDRESLGRAAFGAHVGCLAEEDAPPWQDGPPSWEELGDGDREFYLRIGAAVAEEVRERIAVALEDYAANYPEDIWPPDGTSRDAIGGTAMRHAYRNAARIAREPQERSDGKEPS